jgi:hypothetical protein
MAQHDEHATHRSRMSDDPATAAERADVALTAHAPDERADIATPTHVANDNTRASDAVGWAAPKELTRELAARIHSGHELTCDVLGMQEAQVLQRVGLTHASIVAQLARFNARLLEREKVAAAVKRLREEFGDYKKWLDRLAEIRTSADAATEFLALVRAEHRRRLHTELLVEARVYLKDQHLEWNEHQKMLQSALVAGLTADDVESIYKAAAAGRFFTRDRAPAVAEPAARAARSRDADDLTLDEADLKVVHPPVPGAASFAIAALRAEVAQAARTLDEVARHSELLGASVTGMIIATVAQVRRDLERKEVRVVLVGEKSAGKRTFLNAILGAQVLGDATRELADMVTSVRKMPISLYRATLRDGSTIEFQDHEAGERAAVVSEMEVIRRRLGTDPHERALKVASAELDAALANAAATHAEAARRRMAAVTASAECQGQQASARAQMQETMHERDAAELGLQELGRQTAAMRERIDEEQRTLDMASGMLQDHARQHGIVLGAERKDVAQLRFQTTQLRLAEVTAAVPFFLRSAPWWAFWVLLIRLIVGWRFRAAARMLAEARAQHRHAQLVLAMMAPAERLTQHAQALAELTSSTLISQRSLAALLKLMAAAEAVLSTADEHLQRTNDALADCRKTEDRASLELLSVRSDMLEAGALARFCSEVHALTDSKLSKHEVVELAIGFPATHLPDGFTLIIVPGVSAGNPASREHAWRIIRCDVMDGCLLVSDLKQVMSRSTRDFLQELRPIVPHILLVVSKADQAIANIKAVGSVEPWHQADAVRRAGARQLAKQLGRAPDDVFSIVVAAAAELETGAAPHSLQRHFSGEMVKLFDLLRLERAFLLSARTATALRYSVQRISEAQAQAEAQYHERIAELERQRLPDPRDFQARQLSRIEVALHAHAVAIGSHACEVMAQGIDAIEANWVRAIKACSDKDQVKKTVAQLGEWGQAAIPKVLSEVDEAVAARSRTALQELEQTLLKELRERYRIVQQLTGSGRTVDLGGRMGTSSGMTQATHVHAGVSKALANFESTQLALGAGGALAGAVIGSFVFPGVGTAIGAAVGALAHLIKTLESLKNDCNKGLHSGLEDTKLKLREQFASVGPDVQRRMGALLERELSDAVYRFQSWIEQLMAAERKQIEQEREKLSHLINSREMLVRHDQSLATRQHEAAAVSRALCA